MKVKQCIKNYFSREILYQYYINLCVVYTVSYVGWSETYQLHIHAGYLKIKATR